MVGAVLVLGVLVTGCMTTPVQTAETLGKGRTQVGYEPGLFLTAGTYQGCLGPSFNIAGRVGLSDRVDLGGRVGTSVIEASFKLMLTDPHWSRPIVSVAPRLALHPSRNLRGEEQLLDFKIPLLLGFGDDSRLVLGPYGQALFFVGGDEGGVAIIAGSSIGYAAWVSDSFRVMPELGLGLPVASPGASGGSLLAEGGVLASFNLGFLVGGGS